MGKKGFQKTGKDGEEYFSVPKEFRAATGMSGLTEQGIGIYAGGRFDKAYSCSENTEDVSSHERAKGCAMLLRASGVNFCFYETSEPERILLLISLHARSLTEAAHAFSLLEQDMQGNLYTFGITIRPLSAEDKLYLMHRLATAGMGDARIDVAQYLAKTSGWLQDFKLQHYTEQEGLMKTKDRYSSAMYVRRVQAEHAADVCRCLRQHPCCKMLVSVYGPVSDGEVMESVRKNYIGFEPLLYALTRKRRGIGKIAEGKDERRYVYSGIYFSLSAAGEEMLKEGKEELQGKLGPYGCEAAEFQFYQKQTWQSLAMLNPWEIKQTMLMKSGGVVAMNPFYREEGNAMEEEMGIKAELLAAFDAMTEGGIRCRS